MSREHDDIFAQLCAPFPDAKSRTGTGRTFSYITARQAMNRLDNVVGPANWWDEYVTNGDNAIICKLTIRLSDGTQITKADAGGSAGMADTGDDEKSAFSDAFKRAAVKFGVARYLYGDGVPGYAGPLFDGTHGAHAGPPNAVEHYERTRSNGQSNGNGNGGGGYSVSYGCPKSGKALFAWCMERQDEFRVKVLDTVNGHPAVKGIFPGRMTDWNNEQVLIGYSIMVDTWKNNGVWPGGETTLNDSYSSDAPPASAPRAPSRVEDLVGLKSDIREVIKKIFARDFPGEKLIMPVVLEYVNKHTALMVPPVVISNWISFDDKAALLFLNGRLAKILGGEVVEDDDIPF